MLFKHHRNSALVQPGWKASGLARRPAFAQFRLAEGIAHKENYTDKCSGGPKGGHLKGGHLQMEFRSETLTRHADFAVKFALSTSILTALSKGIPQGNRRLDREGAV